DVRLRTEHRPGADNTWPKRRAQQPAERAIRPPRLPDRQQAWVARAALRLYERVYICQCGFLRHGGVLEIDRPLALDDRQQFGNIQRAEPEILDQARPLRHKLLWRRLGKVAGQ